MNPFKQKDKAKEKEKENEEKQNLIKTIEERIKDYDLAIKYFKENDLSTQEAKGEEDKQKLVDFLEKIKKGKTSEVNEKELPQDITSEYINGYSNDDRVKKYFDIIAKIISEKQKLQMELDNEIKELKKLTKPQILSMKEKIQEDFKKIKNKKVKYDEIINLLKEDFKNKWIPAPLYSETEEDTNIEVINEDVPENTIKIKFGETNYKKANKNVFLTATLVGTNHQETWEQKGVGDWSHIIEWHLGEKEYEEIAQKTIHLKVFEKLKNNKEKFKGEGDFELSELEEKNKFDKKCGFVLQTKRIEPWVDISFKIRNCKKNPKFETFKKRIFCFTKFYPAFKEEC